VVKDCPVPILVLGGSRTGSDEDALQMVREIAQAGATGVFFGRNVFQAANMESFLARARSALGSAATASSS
jgi:DhnA family fructose-bisphosphate aldolase class Ia